MLCTSFVESENGSLITFAKDVFALRHFCIKEEVFFSELKLYSKSAMMYLFHQLCKSTQGWLKHP